MLGFAEIDLFVGRSIRAGGYGPPLTWRINLD
jgi:hypothetical protein